MAGLGNVGPCAVSAITGVQSHDAAKTMRELTGRKAIHGTTATEVVAAIEELGVEMKTAFSTPYRDKWCGLPEKYKTRMTSEESITLNKFCEQNPEGRWVLAITGHWIVYSDGHVSDNGYLFSRKPKALSEYNRGKKSQIRAAYCF